MLDANAALCDSSVFEAVCVFKRKDGATETRHEFFDWCGDFRIPDTIIDNDMRGLIVSCLSSVLQSVTMILKKGIVARECNTHNTASTTLCKCDRFCSTPSSSCQPMCQPSRLKLYHVLHVVSSVQPNTSPPVARGRAPQRTPPPPEQSPQRLVHRVVVLIGHCSLRALEREMSDAESLT